MLQAANVHAFAEENRAASEAFQLVLGGLLVFAAGL
jgi:hypothetical protein